MILAILAVMAGLGLLVWSAERFVDGAAATARHFGMSPLLIGIVIIGFGTSAPEMIVSAFAAIQNTPGIALGNAYGSNITNIALILGLTALISPITVHSQILRKELPLLTAASALAAFQVWDGEITRIEAIILLVVFLGVMTWTVWQGLRRKSDILGNEVEAELNAHPLPIRRALFWVIVGLVLMLISSRILVWGAVEIARFLGVSELIIGLTVVAIGTSLPELASSLIAIRKGEHDFALGNVIGSNIFNTLAVVGIAGAICPMSVEPEVFLRDIPFMNVLTVSLFVIGFGFRGGQGRINRVEGALLVASYLGYTVYLIMNSFIK